MELQHLGRECRRIISSGQLHGKVRGQLWGVSCCRPSFAMESVCAATPVLSLYSKMPAGPLPPAVVGVLEVQMCSTSPIFLGVPGIALRLSACVSEFDLMSHLPALGVLTGLLLLP